LLVSITMHKLYRQVRWHVAEKRSVDVEEGRIAASDEQFLVSREPSPEEAIAVADELQAFMSTLEPFPRRILELRLQGHELSEIADATSRSERTVRRNLLVIRERLAELLGHADA
jgi:DNA-directed RNA polymerase specialized sigma24 family protein